MDIISIHSAQNVESIAGLYKHLYKERKTQCAIQVPTELRDYRMGGKGELLQFILTWADKYPDSPVVTHIPPNSSDANIRTYLENLFEQEHGFVLALRSRKWGLEVPREFADVKRVKVPHYLIEEALSGTGIFKTGQAMVKNLRTFIAVDDHIERGNLILQDYTKLYLKRTAARSPMKVGFAAQLKLLFDKQSRVRNQVASLNPMALSGFIENITRFAYEVFENAGRWGTKEHGNSIRGILVHLHAREVESTKSLSEQVGSLNPIYSYLEHFKLDDGYENTSFLEITIFDNGPTLANHLLKRAPKNINEELKATRQCLLLASGRSSKSNEGQGLYDTIKLIHRCRGLIKYRGNRLSVFRDFVGDPLDETRLAELESIPRGEREKEMLNILYMKDWTSRMKSPEAHAAATGSLFTIIVPVKEINL
jgi:hypothetical protein